MHPSGRRDGREACGAGGPGVPIGPDRHHRHTGPEAGDHAPVAVNAGGDPRRRQPVGVRHHDDRRRSWLRGDSPAPSGGALDPDQRLVHVWQRHDHEPARVDHASAGVAGGDLAVRSVREAERACILRGRLMMGPGLGGLLGGDGRPPQYRLLVAGSVGVMGMARHVPVLQAPTAQTCLRARTRTLPATWSPCLARKARPETRGPSVSASLGGRGRAGRPSRLRRRLWHSAS